VQDPDAGRRWARTLTAILAVLAVWGGWEIFQPSFLELVISASVNQGHSLLCDGPSLSLEAKILQVFLGVFAWLTLKVLTSSYITLLNHTW
jgi:hypothetical protein